MQLTYFAGILMRMSIEASVAQRAEVCGRAPAKTNSLFSALPPLSLISPWLFCKALRCNLEGRAWCSAGKNSLPHRGPSQSPEFKQGSARLPPPFPRPA